VGAFCEHTTQPAAADQAAHSVGVDPGTLRCLRDGERLVQFRHGHLRLAQLPADSSPLSHGILRAVEDMSKRAPAIRQLVDNERS